MQMLANRNLGVSILSMQIGRNQHHADQNQADPEKGKTRQHGSLLAYIIYTCDSKRINCARMILTTVARGKTVA